MTTDVLALANGGFQRMTRETSFPKDHAQMKSVSASKRTRGASAGGQAMPGLLHLGRLKIRKEHRAFA
ncbi:hypothetical protein BQ8482_420023 [Mesorhizobium delmotii]|uniref:Uncharacterized protein n=1 Tax=Mesorhizobium delmotii TaxID=1631247 RepID=A0A2P9AT90_9HYPH|nr:hypothetical protein BQ8482_420023 [Mesorhizobium delmotii]